MKKSADFIEYISPKLAAKKLGIAVTTLRKYSSLIEKFSENASYFERDSQNSRLYTRFDMSLLKRVITLKNRPDLSLNKAVKQALSENGVSGGRDVNMRFNSDTNYSMLPSQDDKITQYESLINTLIESNLKLSDQLSIAIEKLEGIEQNRLETKDSSKKMDIFSSIFKGRR